MDFLRAVSAVAGRLGAVDDFPLRSAEVTPPRFETDKVANPARGQLNREEKENPCPRSCLGIWSRKTSSAVPSRISLLISILRLNLVRTCGIPPEFRGGVHSFVKAAIRHRISPEFMGSRIFCVPMAFTAESSPAQGQ